MTNRDPGTDSLIDPDSTASAGIEVLRGGDRVQIRPIRASDQTAERTFIERLSAESRRFRFLETMNSPSDALLRQLTVIDDATEAAYVALIDDPARNKQIGVARFSMGPDGRDCEFAIAVSDAWQGKGLGTHLMRYLITAARSRGIVEMHSSDPADNDRMRRFAKHPHVRHTPDPDDATQVIYSIVTAGRRAQGLQG